MNQKVICIDIRCLTVKLQTNCVAKQNALTFYAMILSVM